MKTKLKKLTMVSFIAVMACVLLSGVVSSKSTSRKKLNTGKGDSDSLMLQYNKWQQQQQGNAEARASNDKHLKIAMGWFNGMSSEYSSGGGFARINLRSGEVAVDVGNLSAGEWDFWLVSEKSGTNSLTPSPETMKFIGRLNRQNDIATLKVNLGAEAFINFKVARAFVTRADEKPNEAFALTGIPTLFERLQYKEFLRAQESDNSFFSFLFPTAQAESAQTDLDLLVAKGRALFIGEKFNGNGRSCATCHPEDNNLTIDPIYIAKLPATDPLFVAEFDPNLSKNFENPEMMRKFGLVLTNIDGFQDLEKTFVLRSVPHLLSLSTSTKTDLNVLVDFTAQPPINRLGWGGDGSPGSGTLREFAIGAVIQHFPKTLARKAGSDYRLPTDDELDALEAYLLSLGRNEDIDISKIKLKVKSAKLGLKVFTPEPPPANTPESKMAGKCNTCHFNAGATTGFQGAFSETCFTCAPSNFNGVFAIGADDIDMAKKLLPPDGGYGVDQIPAGNRFGGSGLGFCTRANFPGIPPGAPLCLAQFRTPPLIEAADTTPFFHHGLMSTIEEAVEYYNDDVFNKSFTGNFPAFGNNDLSDERVDALSSLLRVLNVIENIRSSIAMQQRLKKMDNLIDQKELIRLAMSDLDDAIDVISNGVLKPEASKGAVMNAILNLNAARTLLINASQASDPTMVGQLIDQSIEKERLARAALVDVKTLPTSFQN
jgi:cytochrome c peroxidase